MESSQLHSGTVWDAGKTSGGHSTCTPSMDVILVLDRTHLSSVLSMVGWKIIFTRINLLISTFYHIWSVSLHLNICQCLTFDNGFCRGLLSKPPGSPGLVVASPLQVLTSFPFPVPTNPPSDKASLFLVGLFLHANDFTSKTLSLGSLHFQQLIFLLEAIKLNFQCLYCQVIHCPWFFPYSLFLLSLPTKSY